MKVSLFVNQDQGPRECTEEKQRGGTAEGNGRTKMTTDGPAEHTDAVRWGGKGEETTHDSEGVRSQQVRRTMVRPRLK